MKRTPTALIILDGFGYRKQRRDNAIAQAYTPHLSTWLKRYPHTILRASGTAVGLLEGTVGNSECGHQTIGAGRIVEQPVVKLDQLIRSCELSHDARLQHSLHMLKNTGGRLHIMGLLSDGGIHSHERHAHALIRIATCSGIKEIFVHPFLDGRDSSPRSALRYLDRLQEVIIEVGAGTISSIHGRFYAMDRDRNWQRTQKSYDVLTSSARSKFIEPQEVVEYFYNRGIYDEFIPPTPLAAHEPITTGDGVIFFNIRPERAVQLTQAFCEPSFNHFPVKDLALSFFITGVQAPVLPADYGLVAPEPVKNTFLDILERHGFSLFTIAESEKFAQVTYFFNSHHVKRASETRVAIPSLKLATYKDHPAMSAESITATVLTSLETDPKDFYLINYANADMVGHSGDLAATIQAIECLDNQLAQLEQEIVECRDGTLYITADHGNAECMWDEEARQPHTSHTANPVPFIMIAQNVNAQYKLPVHTLADIAPFILKNLGIAIPPEMAPSASDT